MRVFVLKCITFDGMGDDPHDGRCIEHSTIETHECITVSEMVENFNKMLALMGFIAQVDIVEKDE